MWGWAEHPRAPPSPCPKPQRWPSRKGPPFPQHPSSCQPWWGVLEGCQRFPPQPTGLGDPNLLGMLNPTIVCKGDGGCQPPPRSLLCSPPAAADAGDAAEDPEADEGLTLAPSSSSSSLPPAPDQKCLHHAPSCPGTNTAPSTLRCCSIALANRPAPSPWGQRGDRPPSPGVPCLGQMLPQPLPTGWRQLCPPSFGFLCAPCHSGQGHWPACSPVVSLVPVSPRAACLPLLHSAWPWLKWGNDPSPSICPAVGDRVAPPQALADTGGQSLKKVP